MAPFYLLIGVMPLVRHWFWSETAVAGFTMNKCLGVICLGVALVQLVSRDRGMRFLSTRQSQLFLAFSGLTLASFLIRGPAVPIDDSLLSSFVSFLLLFFVTSVLVQSPNRLRWVLLSLVGGLTFVSFHTIREWLAGSNSRPGWVAGDPNYLSFSLAMGLPLAFNLLFFRVQPRWQRLFTCGCLTTMVAALALAGSRGGFTMLIVAFLFVTWRSPHRFRYLAVGGALVTVLTLSPWSPLWRVLAPSAGDVESNEVRAALLEAGVRMFSENPLFGAGAGNFKPLIGKYGGPDVDLRHLAHNTYLEVAAEQGLVGLVIFLAILYSTWRSLAYVRGQTRMGGLVHTAASGLEGALVTAAVGMLFLSVMHVRLFWFIVMLSMSLPSLARREAATRERTTVGPTTVDARRESDAGLVVPSVKG